MIAIIDSGGANIASILFALERLGVTAELTTKAKTIRAASHVILPGVGAAKAAMQRLHKYALVDVIKELKQPVLGICLGMQLFYEYSDEGDVACLGFIRHRVREIKPGPDLVVPHMGWNKLQLVSDSGLFQNIPSGSHAYFVHSYAAPLTEHSIAVTEYGQPFAAAIQINNFYATQFHPERSGKVGQQVLANFLRLS